MRYILALDQGTTSSRALLIDHEAEIKAKAQKEFTQYFPKAGWVEHDPLEIWSSQAAVITEVLAKSGVSCKDIACIGITNQRETTIVWDKKTGQPIARAIVWQDRRTAERCQKLKNEGLEPLFNKKTGLLLDPYFSGTKLQWILENVPGAYEKANRGELAFGTVDSWLVWKLTNGALHITDATNASRTLLFNIHTGKWDEELLKILNIPTSLLPEVRSSSEVYGETAVSFLSPSLPISGIAGDQQAALFGQACFKKGMAKSTYGTGCFMLMHTGESFVSSENKLLTTIAYQIGDKIEYALEGSVFNGGAVVQWLRDGLGIIKNSYEVETLAKSVQDSHGVYFVPAFTGLGAPYWDPYAQGTILGITRGTTKAHIAYAALEGIAFQVAEVLTAMQHDAGVSLKELRVDGGAASDDLLMQMQADLLQTTVVRPKIFELTALGAAYLAGLSIGFWKNEAELSDHWKEDKRFEPKLPESQVLEKLDKWRKAVACSREFI